MCTPTRGTPKTRKVRVLLAQLVREQTSVVVEVPATMTDAKIEDRLDEIYDEHDCCTDWEIDFHWGADEGTHELLGPADEDDGVDIRCFLDDEDDDVEEEDECLFGDDEDEDEGGDE